MPENRKRLCQKAKPRTIIQQSQLMNALKKRKIDQSVESAHTQCRSIRVQHNEGTAHREESANIKKMVSHARLNRRGLRSIKQISHIMNLNASKKRKVGEQLTNENVCTQQYVETSEFNENSDIQQDEGTSHRNDNADMQQPKNLEDISLSPSMSVELIATVHNESFAHTDLEPCTSYSSTRHCDVQNDHFYNRSRSIASSNDDTSADKEDEKNYENHAAVFKRRCTLLPPHSKKIIRNVFKFLQNLQRQALIVDAEKSLSIATGISSFTLKKILKEKIYLNIPKMKQKRTRRRIAFSKIDSFDLDNIRRIFHRFFRKQEHVSLRQLLDVLKSEMHFPYSYSTLWKIIHKIGFKYHKRDNRLFVYERREIMQARKHYLSQISRFRREGRLIFYQDETWCNECSSKQKAWYDKGIEKNPHEALVPGSDLSLGYKDRVGKGKRLIISHVGGSEGFVKGAEEVFKSNKTCDYHEEMNGEHFEKWFANDLLPRLPPNSVIVIDNAPYHSRQIDRAPTSANRKSEMIAWLDKHVIHYNKSANKAELYKLILQNKLYCKQYIIDTYANERGFTVLRLPPYHCELNPIELIWAQIKHYIAMRNTTYKISDVEKLVHESFQGISSDHWKKAIEHVIKKENEYMQLLSIDNSNEIAPFVISLDSDQSDNDESNSEEI